MAIDKASLESLRIDRGTGDARPWKVWWVVAAAALVLIVAIGIWLAARPARAAVRVMAAKAIAGGTRATVLNATGYVTARRQATVSSKFTGKVLDVDIEEGMHVATGQVLARLDAAIPQHALNLALAQARATGSALQETRVRIEQARVDMQRATALSSQQIQSKAEYDKAKAEYDALQARLVAQQDQSAVAERQVQLSRQDVDDAVIRAPFAGIVVSKNAQPGEMISPNSAGGGFTRTGICTIVDMDSLEIEVDVNEAYINRVKSGQPVEAVLDAYPDWRIPAHVITVIPTADRQKATVKVRIGFDVKDARILPDMGVKVSFIDGGAAAAQTHGVSIPKSAVRHDGDQDIVFVFDGEKVDRRAVKIGDSDDASAKVLSGLNDGEQVVVEGPAGLVDRQKVAVQK